MNNFAQESVTFGAVLSIFFYFLSISFTISWIHDYKMSIKLNFTMSF